MKKHDPLLYLNLFYSTFQGTQCTLLSLFIHTPLCESLSYLSPNILPRDRNMAVSSVSQTTTEHSYTRDADTWSKEGLCVLAKDSTIIGTKDLNR